MKDQRGWQWGETVKMGGLCLTEVRSRATQGTGGGSADPADHFMGKGSASHLEM